MAQWFGCTVGRTAESLGTWAHMPVYGKGPVYTKGRREKKEGGKRKKRGKGEGKRKREKEKNKKNNLNLLKCCIVMHFQLKQRSWKNDVPLPKKNFLQP